MCKLNKLEEFDLDYNDFEGILPPCLKNLTSLQLLDLSRNRFTGNISSSWIASLTSLKYIDFGYNQFEGLFPFSSFSNHTMLEVVRFTCDSNKFQITEISGWVSLFQLQFLILSKCLGKLSSEIPTFLFHQYNLRVVDLSHNKLKGLFPVWLLGNNKRLEFLSLKNNSFLGQFHLPLHLNSSISWVDVSKNQLEGQLQENIGKILWNLTNLDLSGNAFQGCLPSSIGNMSRLEKLDLSHNKFSGVVPEELFAGCLKLMALKLSNNTFLGNFSSTQFNSSTLWLLELNDNNFSGTLSNLFSKFKILDYLDASNNYLSGKIPRWICNETSPLFLILRNNFFRGHFECEENRFDFLDLSHNFLSGSLPSWSSTQTAKHVHLKGNIFSGSIPEAFFNLSSLLTLDISDNSLSGAINIPHALGAFSSLRILSLRGNSLNGFIPTQLCRLLKLSMVDLSNNNFSGSIPNCIGKITFGEIGADDFWFEDDGFGFLKWDSSYPYGSLLVKNFEFQDTEPMFTEDEENFVTKNRPSSYKGDILDLMSGLDLSCNNLTGLIPQELGMLSRIHALNLSHNQLIGSIPNTFSNLTQIESLDLSHNSLSGEIPPQLIALQFLEVFQVAYNNLSGRIPEGKAQFGTFDANSYIGNPLLCGPPLKKNCTSVDDSPSMLTGNASDEKWYKIDLVVFFASFSVSYIIFFLGVIILLYINPYWRQWCFNLIEDSIYSSYYFVQDTLRKLSNGQYFVYN